MRYFEKLYLSFFGIKPVLCIHNAQFRYLLYQQIILITTFELLLWIGMLLVKNIIEYFMQKGICFIDLYTHKHK